jgi:coenzyme F420 biosynthesis associated uncharacterized protein
MPGPVDWNRAERIAIAVAARQPGSGTGQVRSEDFESICRVAEERVESTTGLRSLLGPADIQVVDRADWIRANLASFQALLDPILSRWLQTTSGRTSQSVARSISAQVAGAEVGVMLGWMSARVLGQYDLLFGDDQAGSGSASSGSAQPGTVYLVGQNMVGLEERFGFDPEQFRLWITLHELTHRAQFTGVPWMREYFMSRLHATLELASPDPARLVAALREAARDRGAARQRLRDGGVVAMVASPEQQAVFNEIAGLMSLLEGHGDVVMDRAGADLIPSAARFSRVLHERRRRANPLVKLVQRLVGLEGKLNQYAAGERFIAAIEAGGGDRAVDRCWEAPENLPSLNEVRTPELWLERMGLDPVGIHRVGTERRVG